MLLLRFVGLFLLRFAERTFEALLLFQLPPRLTRAACPGDRECMTTEQRPASIACIVEDAFQLWMWVEGRVAKFSVIGRRHVGHRALNVALDAVSLLTQASYLGRGERRLRCLDEANRSLVVLRILLRGARQLGHISQQQHEHSMVLVDAVGRQIGGWIRAERGRDAL